MDLPPVDRLPCGCVLTPTIVAGVRTLTLEACSPTCHVVRDALQLADERGVDAEVREL